MISFIAVFVLLACSAFAEPPVGRQFRRQDFSPAYQPRGFRPSVPFNFPQKQQQQQQQPQDTYAPPPSYGPPAPKPSYGPPPAEEPEVTTENSTEEVTTENYQVENLKVNAKKEEQKEKLQQRPVFIVVPPKVQSSAAIVAVPETKVVYTVPQSAYQIQQFQSGRLVAVPAEASSAAATSIYTPFSASFVQVVQ